MSTHIPVMLREVTEALAPQDGGIFVDGTFGAGGYSTALLAQGASKVYGIDRDPDAIIRGARLPETKGGNLVVLKGRFSDMEALLAGHGVGAANGVTLDLGVSSFQLDEAERGFSFREDGPLDMRMSGEGPSAADLVNTLPEAQLADIIWRYGEEKKSRSIARAIVAARPITRTRALAELIEKVMGPAARRERIHPATRTFQALRIYVNEELAELENGLAAAERLLAPNGRLAVVSFHSLEDRIVKRFLSSASGRDGTVSRHAPMQDNARAPSFTLLRPFPRVPSDEETNANPRARSAKLRAATRTSAAAHGSHA